MENKQVIIVDKKSKKKEQIGSGAVAGNGSTLNGLGTISCAECENVIAYFPPDMVIEEEDNLEFYCYMCAAGLSAGEH